MNKKKNNSWYKKQTTAQNAYLNNLVDWVDDDTMNDATEVLSPNVVDFDELDRQRSLESPLEQGDLPSMSEEEVSSLLVDDLVEQDENVLTDDEVEEGYFDGTYVPSGKELEERGIEPVEDTGEEVDEEAEADADAENLAPLSKLMEAWRDNRVVKISYLTLGKKRGREGSRYILKREIGQEDRIPGTGVNIWRIVEPHDIFTADNGHEILVGYDRSVRHIRAFRLSNITDVEFCKKRGSEEPSYFNPGRNIKIKNPDKNNPSGKIKGIEAMNVNIFQNLKGIGDDLEGKGLSKTASVITDTMSNLLNIKTAQYVGPQGYWIRQKRCWDNCYRQKRTTAPEKAAQVVWTECWEEYNKAINNNQSGWEKYAQEDTDLFKYASDKQKDWVTVENKKFAKAVESKMASGESQGMSIYKTLEEKDSEYTNILLADADNLSKLAEQLKVNGQDELSEKIANASIELLKEAQFGGGWEGAFNKVRKFNPFSAKSRAKGLSGDIRTRLKRISQRALQIANQFNTVKQQMHQSGREEMGYQQGVAQQQQQQQANKEKWQQRGQAVKNAPGQAWNWAKDKAQQVATNPAVQQVGQAFSESDSDIKTAQAKNPYAQDPSYQAGAKDLVGSLREEFSSLMMDLRNESMAMGQMATMAKDAESKKRASEVSQRMNAFIQKATPFEQQFMKNQNVVTQADALVQELQSFANDLNQIQVGQYDANASEAPAMDDPIYSDPGADPDSDGVPNAQDPDRNNDNTVDNPAATQAPQGVVSPDISPIVEKIKNNQPISKDEATKYRREYYMPKLRELEGVQEELNQLKEEYQKAEQLKK